MTRVTWHSLENQKVFCGNFDKIEAIFDDARILEAKVQFTVEELQATKFTDSGMGATGASGNGTWPEDMGCCR